MLNPRVQSFPKGGPKTGKQATPGSAGVTQSMSGGGARVNQPMSGGASRGNKTPGFADGAKFTKVENAFPGGFPATLALKKRRQNNPPMSDFEARG